MRKAPSSPASTAFARILAFVRGDAREPDLSRSGDIRAASAALLVEAALRDDAFVAAERLSITRLLTNTFDLSLDESTALFTAAARANGDTHNLFGHIGLLVNAADAPARTRVVEMLWSVATADGELHTGEETLIWKLADLLHVPEIVCAEARARARREAGLGK